VTLIVGIIASLITAVIVSRYLMRLAARGGLLANTKLLFGFRPLGGGHIG
jgi:preprotein translocase subunit SecD